MALTALAFVAVQVLVPNLVRPHLLPPVDDSAPVTAQVVRGLSLLGREPTIGGLKIPGGWVIRTSDLKTPDGRRVARESYTACVGRPLDAIPDCLGALNLHVDVACQPPGRCWRFQRLEAGLPSRSR